MRAKSLPVMVLAAALAGTVSLWGSLRAAVWSNEGQQVKHHHELRGVIVKVEVEKNQFTIKTGPDRVVLCVIDAKTVLKRDGKKITLGEVRAGERARCHCAAIKDGKHYSQQLLLEKKND